MKTIWRISIDPGAHKIENEITAPKGAEIMFFRQMGDRPHVWLKVDTDAEQEVVGTVAIVPTGKDMTKYFEANDWEYIGSDLFLGGKVVLHAFWKDADLDPDEDDPI